MLTTGPVWLRHATSAFKGALIDVDQVAALFIADLLSCGLIEMIRCIVELAIQKTLSASGCTARILLNGDIVFLFYPCEITMRAPIEVTLFVARQLRMVDSGVVGVVADDGLVAPQVPKAHLKLSGALKHVHVGLLPLVHDVSI